MILECSGYTHSPRPVESIGDKVYIVNNLLVESDVNSQMLHRNGPGPVGVVLLKYKILDDQDHYPDNRQTAGYRRPAKKMI